MATAKKTTTATKTAPATKAAQPAIAAAPPATGGKKVKKEKVIVYSPLGRFSFPYLVTPDTGRPNSDGKWKVELMIPKSKFETECKGLVAAVLACASEYHGRSIKSLKELTKKVTEEVNGVETTTVKRLHPFTDMDEERDCPEVFKGHIRIRAKSTFKPLVIGPHKNEDGKFDALPEEVVKQIKGGDYGRLVMVVYAYSQSGGGVTFGLNGVQFGYAGDPIGQGALKQVQDMSEVEIPMDAPENMIDTEEAASEEDSSMSFS